MPFEAEGYHRDLQGFELARSRAIGSGKKADLQEVDQVNRVMRRNDRSRFKTADGYADAG
ncbi:hypothetical protein [Bradyrhizobium sp. NBAIM08]|uniref:hypothetical protein n=1 Tax=Bradyrhizobium sp. NBAIM08 TaxID=2793815 RepID=UPI001CD804EB|nr:hypothetical protein [Bradyrhizobium sp. NBAIM08]MCA1474146.1 hypothetical protein [Bradyrhizobium sp. NBAIM08]